MHVTSALGCLVAGGLMWLIYSVSANLVRARRLARDAVAPAGIDGVHLLRVTDATSLDAEFVRQVAASLASVEPNDS